MRLAFLLYDDMTPLDLIGPYQCLATAPGMEVQLVARARGPRRTDSGIQMIADTALHEAAEPDVIVVPGTGNPKAALGEVEAIAWLREVAPRARYVTSVCTGALLLGAAGLLAGRRATTHWMALEALRRFGATPVSERVVVDGPVITAAGVSAGIDMGLRLLATLAGERLAQRVQLLIEYDPDPPFSCGSTRTAPPDLVAEVQAMLPVDWA